MSEAFGPLYAEGYDSMYRAKDYRAECDLLEGIWSEAGVAVRTVLDLGCGTGGHSLELARRGYEVTGVDVSPEMVAIARRKKEEAGAEHLDYVVSDVAALSLGREVDAAIMMFNVIGYLAEPGQRSAALAAIRGHLRAGSLFVFDYWHGPAVLASPPGGTFREIPVEGGQLLRGASTEFHPEQRLCDVTMTVWKIEGDRVAGRASERHRVRFYDDDELRELLGRCGFELVRTAAFSDPAQPPATSEWQAIGIARAAS